MGLYFFRGGGGAYKLEGVQFTVSVYLSTPHPLFILVYGTMDCALGKRKKNISISTS